jgi:DNA-directed RNA polymerase specialized sigma24 family protein
LIDPADYSHWLSVAAHHTRRRDEAADLLQDALLIAIDAGRLDLNDPRNRAWFNGVISKQAAMTARSAARRKIRDAAHRPGTSELRSSTDRDALLAMIRQLPRSARIVATLALHGMKREEIAYVLDLSPTALRQRLTTIRRAWKNVSADVCSDGSITTDTTIGQDLELGLLRRSLLAIVQQRSGLGFHDPDGHLIIVEKNSSSQSPVRRQRRGSSNRRT